MATDLGPTRTAPAAKNDSLIAVKLAQAEGRIRGLDLTLGILGFLAITLAYAFLMGLCDRQWALSSGARLFGFLAYLVLGAVFLTITLGPPLLRRINPYYAAREMERTLPNAKNSVVNWLDLQERDLPPAIRASLSQKAAKDLGKADLDQAISGRRAGWAGTFVAAALFVVVCFFFSVGPAPFFSLMQRAFLPFWTGNHGIATRTQLTVVKPESGNATVPLTEAVGRAIRHGIPVAVASRAPQGRVSPTYTGGGGGHDLMKVGAMFAGDLSGVKTRILMAVLLGAGLLLAEVREGIESRGAQVGVGPPQAA